MTGPNENDLSGLLHTLERDPNSRFHVVDWWSLLGKALVDRLCLMGVLVEDAHRKRYPCPECAGARCRCRVVAKKRDDGKHLYLAICDEVFGCHDPIVLDESVVKTLSLSRHGVIQGLRRAFEMRGAADPADTTGLDVFRIGELQERPAYLALTPGKPGFETWLASRTNAYVMVPAGRWLSPLLVDQCAPGRPTELIVLKDVLEMGEDGFVAHWPRRRREVIVAVYSHDGRRELTDDEYRELVARAAEFDLFLDLAGTTSTGRCPGGRRNERGAFEPAELTKTQAAVVCELVQSKCALRAADFRRVESQDVERMLERARKQLDLRLRRYEWRAIHTLSGQTPAATSWRFNPPQGIRWSVIEPLRATPRC